jgi:hypothetical protein|tara:strand:- start:16 stop:1560 length:1545 start_codon:yes stop_codon:yes gene_type:complete
MGTYAQPGITQGQALMAEKADYASGLSKAIGVAKLSKDNQMAMIETSKNALAKQTAELMQEANKIQSSDNSELADSFKQTVIDQIDALDLLEYNSIGRDQTEVTKMRSNLLNGVEGATGNFMKLLAEAEEYNKRVVNGTSPKTVSNTNSNPESIPFLNALGVNSGKQVKTEWDGLGFNLSYKDPSTGKEFKINPTNYYAGREQGLPGLWNEVQDPSPTFKASYDQLAKKFPNINRVTEKTGTDGRLTTVASLDSRKAYDNIRNGILNDKIIRNGINGDTMQFLSGSGYYDKGIGVAYDPENGDQENELMEAITNYTMDQYSKGSGNQITDIKTKSAKTDDDVNTSTKLNHTDFINTLGGIEGEIDIVETPTGLPPKMKDAKKGKVYQNQVEFNKDGSKNPDFEKVYRFDGDKYIELDPGKDSFADQDKLKSQKLAEIRKYLENKENVFRGNNAEVQASDSLDNPDPNKIYRKGGTDANPTFIEIDMDDLFSLDVLGDLNKMEVALNKALGINPI